MLAGISLETNSKDLEKDFKKVIWNMLVNYLQGKLGNILKDFED